MTTWKKVNNKFEKTDIVECKRCYTIQELEQEKKYKQININLLQKEIKEIDADIAEINKLKEVKK